MTIIIIIFGIAGSLGLFLYGLKQTSDSIQKAAGDKLHKTLGLMTKNRFTALLTGIGVTGLVQSSSATSVMTVSFVNAGLLKLPQSIGVIIGANIGTTLTAWIIAIFGFKFSISSVAIPIAALGIVLFFSKYQKYKFYGEFFLGFSILLLGLQFLKESIPDIQVYPEVLQFITNFEGKGMLSYFVFLIIGTVLTVILQSSSATMAITQTMVFAGWIDFPSACAIVIGENIGTTVTAQLASLGTNVNARRTATFHTFFNIIGAIWMTIIFPFYISFILNITPFDLNRPETLTTSLALFHTLFNLINAFIFIWFVPQFANLVTKIIKSKTKEEEDIFKLKYLNSFMQAPEMQIYNAKQESSRMVEINIKMYTLVKNLLFKNSKDSEKDFNSILDMETACDELRYEISRFLSNCPRENLSSSSINNIGILIKTVDELENISDSSQNLGFLTKKIIDKNIDYPKQVIEEIEPYIDLVQQFLYFIETHLNERLETSDYKVARDLEKRINESRNILKKKARKRIEEGSEVKKEIILIDILNHIEHIGDYSMKIAKALADYSS